MHERKITPLKQVKTKGARPRRKQSDWAKLISEWEASGQSQKAFCEAKDLCYRNFNQWKGRIKKTALTDEANTAVPFIPVRVKERDSATLEAAPTVAVDLPNNIKLSLNIDTASTAALIKSLSEPVC